MESKTELISDMEAVLMKAVWSKKEPATFTDIRKELSKKYDWSNQYIQTLIQRLVKKEILGQERREVYYYYALVEEEEYTAAKTNELVDKVFDHNVKGLLAALVNNKNITEEDLEDLKKFWRKENKLDE